jgi:hypothetical protein
LGVGKALKSTPISAINNSPAPLDAGDRHQQVTLASERGDPLLDLRRELVDPLVEEVDVRKDLPDDQRVLSVEAALERFAERGDLGAHTPAREIGEHDRFSRALNKRVEHVPTGCG